MGVYHPIKTYFLRARYIGETDVEHGNKQGIRPPMGKRKDKSWTRGNLQVGVRLEPELLDATEKATNETEETRAEYLRRLLLEDLKKRRLI